MVTAAAPHAGAAPDGCLRDHSARHAPGTRTRPRISQTADEPFPALDDLPPLADVKLVRPRRCAAAALQRDPGPRGEKTQAAARKDPEEQSAQPDGARSHRARSVCPLDTGGPYGCRIECAARTYTCTTWTIRAAGQVRCLKRAQVSLGQIIPITLFTFAGLKVP
jgi:hypothetical protein